MLIISMEDAYEEKFHEVVKGEFLKKESEVIIHYTLSEVAVSLHLKGSQVTLSQRGAIKSDGVIEVGVRHPFYYSQGGITLPFQIEGVTISAESHQVHVVYQLIQGESVVNRISLMIEQESGQ